MKEMAVSVIRKGAWKRLTFMTSHESLLSILQIFEATDDVVDYQVAELDKNFQHIDKYLPDMQGFSKWKPIKRS